MLTDSALSYSSISVSLCWKTERLRFLTEFLSLLWMAEHRYLNLRTSLLVLVTLGPDSTWGHVGVMVEFPAFQSCCSPGLTTAFAQPLSLKKHKDKPLKKWAGNETSQHPPETIKTFHYVLQAPLSFPVLMVYLRDRVILPETSWRISQSTSTTPIKCTIKLPASDYPEATGLYSFPGGNPSELIYFLDHSREKHN